MPGATSEQLGVGDRLRCSRCGTQVRLENVGGGRLECCDRYLEGVAATGPTRGGRRARCHGCGNEVTIEHDGGGRLECCNDALTPAG